MKTATKIFSVTMLIIAMGAGIDADAQKRGRDDHHRDRDHHHDKHHDGKKGKHHRHDHVVVHRHFHPAPVRHVAIRHHRAPRYVYYSDYNVYYDYTRSVYIIYSGRNWVMSRAIPTPMRRVNIERAKRITVDYFNDDFPGYLDRTRPRGSVYVAW